MLLLPQDRLVAPWGRSVNAKQRAFTGAVVAVLLVIGVTFAFACSAPDKRVSHLGLAVDAIPAVAVSGAPSSIPFTESERRDKDIETYATASTLDPFSAHFHSELAMRYLQRGRERGSQADVANAEREARASLLRRTQNNGAAFATLLEVLMEQHRFAEAGHVGRQLVAGNPDEPAYQAMLGEVELELGNYDAATKAFAAVATQRTSLAITTRLARLAEIRGDTALARTLFYRAAKNALLESTMPSEQRAWFQLRVGDYELRHGALTRAESALQLGLRSSQQDYRLLSAMARLRAAQHDWHGVIEFGDQSIAEVLDPATVGLVADAYGALGDTAKSVEYFHAMQIAVPREAGAYHRAWSLYLLDHGLRYADVYKNVRKELQTRHDIYGHDMLGWALYKLGRFSDARVEAQRAMAQGTQDAVFFFHAGMIERALGNSELATTLLARALAINPTFDPVHPAVARLVIDSLSKAEGGQTSGR